ncbi:MAG: polyphosphate kinase 1 [Niastella sp. SCN 39-18]|nr:polyphosphate kinase 1 [Sphingobacteriales bacterium]ODT54471.1 MAG: polyphosphate kinase 1 [Niastella sp. SCN 39-18]OJW10738.1 MAG: polyphosphate kinase 1 [Sphingobacteriales bacterium 39-19]
MYFNRDISWLGFNYRVLMEAKDPSVPLYERIKFLAIFSSNQDEFFRVRFPALQALSKLSKKTIKKEKTALTKNLAQKAQGIINKHVKEFEQVLTRDIIPQLKIHNLFFYYQQAIRPEHTAAVTEIFLSEVLSFIQPVILNVKAKDNFTPQNNYLYFIVTIKDESTEKVQHVAVNIPNKKLQRFYQLAPIGGMHYVIFIDDIIRENMPMLFPGNEIIKINSVKFNRNADLVPDYDFTGDLLEKIEKQISKRDFGLASRFLYESGMDDELRTFLATMFQVEPANMYEGGRYHNMSDLFEFPCPDTSLLYPRQEPILYPSSTVRGEIFEAIDEKEILLHLPYNSYVPVLAFFNQAAIDADVQEIYITLYRVAVESHIVNALISAAKNGKKVTAFIELKARFDEANNIKWSRIMKQAGVKLIYSSPTIKIHSKIGLVKKKVKNELKNYAILSTGNFNENTAGFYTDHVLFTTDKRVCNEMNTLFLYLTKNISPLQKMNLRFNDLWVSQFNMKDEIEKAVYKEITKAKKEGKGLIRIKVNNLEEPKILELFKKASRAGVTIQLLVRSVCCLVPGLKGETENITIRRLVDKYLEHSRLFIFGEGETATVVMGSADLMIRNIRRRIEVAIKIKDARNRKQILDYFDLQWNDTTKLVQLDSNMKQTFITGPVKNNAQLQIYRYIKNLN